MTTGTTHPNDTTSNGNDLDCRIQETATSAYECLEYVRRLSNHATMAAIGKTVDIRYWIYHNLQHLCHLGHVNILDDTKEVIRRTLDSIDTNNERTPLTDNRKGKYQGFMESRVWANTRYLTGALRKLTYQYTGNSILRSLKYTNRNGQPTLFNMDTIIWITSDDYYRVLGGYPMLNKHPLTTLIHLHDTGALNQTHTTINDISHAFNYHDDTNRFILFDHRYDTPAITGIKTMIASDIHDAPAWKREASRFLYAYAINTPTILRLSTHTSIPRTGNGTVSKGGNAHVAPGSPVIPAWKKNELVLKELWQGYSVWLNDDERMDSQTVTAMDNAMYSNISSNRVLKIVLRNLRRAMKKTRPQMDSVIDAIMMNSARFTGSPLRAFSMIGSSPAALQCPINQDRASRDMGRLIRRTYRLSPDNHIPSIPVMLTVMRASEILSDSGIVTAIPFSQCRQSKKRKRMKECLYRTVCLMVESGYTDSFIIETIQAMTGGNSDSEQGKNPAS